MGRKVGAIKRLRMACRGGFASLYRFLTGDHYVRFMYSQFGEDYSILHLVNEMNIGKGVYVDVGAHHPFRYSNTALLHDMGWQGINIDAGEKMLPLFSAYRPGARNLNVAVSDKREPLVFYSFGGSAVDSADHEHARTWEMRMHRPLMERIVQALPLNEILEECGLSDDSIDVLNIDVEGYDLRVLSAINFDRHRPKVICVEIYDFDFDHPDNNEIYSFLRGQNYKMVGFNVVTGIFVQT